MAENFTTEDLQRLNLQLQVIALNAKRDQTRYHTRDDLLKFNVITDKQHERIPELIKDLKKRYKYVSLKDLMQTTLLLAFMKDVGMVEPIWDLNNIKMSLNSVLAWQSKVMAIGRFVIHGVTANRQEMTKAVKSEFITILKNTSRAISNESSTSSDSWESTPVDGSGVIAGTTTETSHKLIELLSSKDKVYSALASIHEPGKEYDSVSGDTKELWGFVVRRVLKMVLPKSEVGSIYSGKTPVTKELLMDKVGVSDEAMVWTIIMAKTEEILEEAKIGESGSAISNMASDSIGGGRKGNRRGGRKQRKRDSDGKILASNKFDAEVGNHQAAYEQFYGRITRSRSSNGGYNDDGNGWYDAAVEKLNVMRNENQSDSLQGTGNTGICPAILAVFTSADGDKENQVGAGFSECAIAMDLIQQRCEV